MFSRALIGHINLESNREVCSTIGHMPHRKPGVLWPAARRTNKRLHDVRISVLEDAYGPAQVEFRTYSLVLIESDVTSECGLLDLGPTLYPRNSAWFAPMTSKLHSEPQQKFDATIFEIPPHWFERAIKRIRPAGDMPSLKSFKTDDDGTLLHSIHLLKRLAMRPELTDISELSEHLIRSVVERIIFQTLKDEEENILSRAGMFSARRLRQLSQFVDDRLTEPVRLADMAEVMGLSQFHFSRVFRTATGATPLQFVLDRRVRLAKTMLKDPGKQLADIALSCGFASQSHFTTSFKSVTGMTPARYRGAGQ